MTRDLKFRKVRDADNASFDDVRVVLQRGRTTGPVRAYFLLPLAVLMRGGDRKIASESMLASHAIGRAMFIADTAGVKLCVIDPDDLWEDVWEV